MDLEQAAEFLADYCASAGNLRALRVAMRTSMDHRHLAELDDLGLLVRVADMLVKRELHVLIDANGLAPWVWTFPTTPSVKLDEAGAGDEYEPLEGEGDETEDQESSFEDTKPEPVIPPVYPQVAQREANAIDFTTMMFCNVMDLLRYVGLGDTDESVVPDSLKDVAKAGGSGVKTATGAASDMLDPLTQGGAAPLGESGIAHEVRMVSGKGGDKLGILAGKSADELVDILSGEDSEIPAADIPKWMRDIAEATGGDITAKARTIAILMQAWMKMQGYEPPPGSEKSGMYGDLAKEQGGKIGNAADEASKGLDGYGPPAEPDDARVHIFQEGDTLISIAILWALGAGLWKEIWDHPANKDIRMERPEPEDLQPGDKLYIPVIPDGQDWIEILLIDVHGEPMGNKPYRIIPTSGGPRTGYLDVEGCALQDDLAPGELKLRFPDSLPGPQDGGGGIQDGPGDETDDSGGDGYTGPDGGKDPDQKPPGGDLDKGEAWVKFKVIDDLTEEPLADVTVTIKLPDGTEQSFTTAADGMIEIDGLPAGKFAIESIADSEGYEVVDIS